MAAVLQLDVDSDEEVDDALEMARGGVEIDLSRSPSTIGDALITRFTQRSPSLTNDARTRTLSGLWHWGVSSSASPSAKRAFLCLVIDETGLAHTTRSDAAVMLALMDDEASLHALAARLHLDVVPPDMASRALLSIEPSEAYDELVPHYRELERWRRRIARFLDERADERWVEEALRIAPQDPLNAVATLRSLGTPRAREELRQWVERASSVRDAGVSEALLALEHLQETTTDLLETLRARRRGG